MRGIIKTPGWPYPDIYGPVTLGGPCTRCGQHHHIGVTCEQHDAQFHEQVRRVLGSIFSRQRTGDELDIEETG
ncbi:MAG: hypothetical protein KGL39_51850 [Patescibacteria group bacterium]|nr:hypothetical protein [Patescibacteria group bacterium]